MPNVLVFKDIPQWSRPAVCIFRSLSLLDSPEQMYLLNPFSAWNSTPGLYTRYRYPGFAHRDPMMNGVGYDPHYTFSAAQTARDTPFYLLYY